MSDQSGLNTPSFGGQHFGTPAGPSYSADGSQGSVPAHDSAGYAGEPTQPMPHGLGAQPAGAATGGGYPGGAAAGVPQGYGASSGSYGGTYGGSDGRIPGYGPADFPAPAGVTTMAPAPVAVATKPRRGLAAVIVASALSAVLGVGAGIGSYEYFTGAQGVTSPITVTTQTAADSPKLDGTIAAAAAKIQPSVVTITVQAGNSGDIGTGVVLDKDGHILTNNHVVEAAAKGGSIEVTFHDGTTAKATIVGTSDTNDLAVIKVDGASNLVPATFAKSNSVEVGQAVVAVGAPLGLSETVTSGIVSNTSRPVRSGDDGNAVYMAVQTDAAINPGNSGGPLVDLNGAVVGINSSIAGTGSGNGDSQSGNIGIGFSIPSDVVVRVASELISGGKYTNAALGVSLGSTGDAQQPTAGGVALQQVTADGPAAKAGLEVGDVVTKVNDFSITSADGLIAATRYYAPGDKVSVTYTRDGSTATAEVTLGSL